MMNATARDPHRCFLSEVILRTFLLLGRCKLELSEARESKGLKTALLIGILLIP